METRKNTLKLVFEGKVKSPSHLEVLRFFAKTVDIPAVLVHSIYKDENDQSFFVKFVDERAFNQFCDTMNEHYRFPFKDGGVAKVKFEMASKMFRYIRIFNLPPETEDKDIAGVLTRYGKIHQFVRERYPTDYNYPVFSGIRGVHMELEKEIPASLFIGHFRARIFYDGLKNRCFFCKAEGHLKVDCPKLAGLRETEKGGAAGSSQSGEQQKGLYSHVAASLRLAVADQPVSTLSMTTLPLRNISKPATNYAMKQREPTNSTVIDQLESGKTSMNVPHESQSGGAEAMEGERPVNNGETRSEKTSTEQAYNGLTIGSDNGKSGEIHSTTSAGSLNEISTQDPNQCDGNGESEQHMARNTKSVATNEREGEAELNESFSDEGEISENPTDNDDRRVKNPQKRRTDADAESDELEPGSWSGKGRREKKKSKKQSALKAIENRTHSRARSK